MEWGIFVTSVGLLLVFEGMLPFLSPDLWRGMMQQMLLQSDRTLRIVGLVSMLSGLVIVCIAHPLFNK
jgi:uncharacterized protein YjeT (DUF2065 family)